MRDRVITAAVLAPIVLAILFLSSPWPIASLAGLVAILSAVESRSLLPNSPRIRFVAALTFLLGAYAAIRFGNTLEVAATLLALSIVGIVGVSLVTSGKSKSPAVSELGSMWFCVPLASCVSLHTVGVHATVWCLRSPLLLALLPVWAGDIAGICAGMAFGKHLLAPTISPKKTVEGAMANLFAATLTGALLGPLLHVSFACGLICGSCAGLVGQAGDLFESYVKRCAGVKDSGTLLPGHGGILDRIDSLLFTAPAIALIVSIFR